jgi:succinate dehydrogenase/fumarate reductase flavoprotein subunit
VYNREWLRYLELKNMLDNLDCIVEAALAREESRGSHYRHDFPQTDNEKWLLNQIINKKKGRLEIRRQPPVLTKMRPPAKVEKYGL